MSENRKEPTTSWNIEITGSFRNSALSTHLSIEYTETRTKKKLEKIQGHTLIGFLKEPLKCIYESEVNKKPLVVRDLENHKWFG